MLQEIRRTRREIRTQENAYKNEHEALVKDEDALEAEERSFYRKYEGDLVTATGPASFTVSRSSKLATPSRKKKKTPPRPTGPVDEYQAKIGEANILHERLEELPLEKEEYLQEQRNLESLGQKMDPLDLEFLNSYDDIFAKYNAELAILESEIQRLEPAALENGLDPQATYSQLRPIALDHPILEDQPNMPHGVSRPDSVIENMPIDLQLADAPPGDGADAQPGNEALPATTSTTEIYQWLQGIPTMAFRRFSRTTRKRGGHNNNWVRISWNWVPGSWGKAKANESERGETTTPSRPQYGKNWVSVDLLRPSQPCANTNCDLDLPKRPRSIGDFRTDPDGEITPYIGLTGLPPPPNTSHEATLENKITYLDDYEPHSV